ncbi:MAG TPA: diacylglycerol kinase family protein [Anaerolineales bacterium]
MTTKVILNPYAGRWLGLAKKEAIETALREAGVDFELELTERAGHATELAANAVKLGYNPIVAVGGDGSINEVINGIYLCAKDEDGITLPSLGVIPLGTANDLVVNLGLPKDIPSAAKVIAAGKSRTIDLGRVTFGAEKTCRYFSNNSAIGMEPTVTLIQEEELVRMKGIARYLAATIIAVFRNAHWTVSLEWEGGDYQGPANLVTVGNSPLTGGLFYMTPHANPEDGLLTCVFGYLPSRLKILSVLPKTMKPGEGSYVEHPAIQEIHTPWLKIHTHTPTPLHTDGVIQSKSVTDVEYSILPSKLSILIP